MRSLLLLTLAAVGLPLAACGSASTSSATNAAASGKSASALAFAQCLRSHGVPNYPDPSGSGHIDLAIQSNGSSTSVNGIQVNGPAFQTAMQACRSKLPGGGRPGPVPVPASMRQAALAFSRCMRSHGVSGFPDPNFNGGGVTLRVGRGGIDKNSPAFTAAQTACQPLAQKLFQRVPAGAP